MHTKSFIALFSLIALVVLTAAPAALACDKGKPIKPDSASDESLLAHFLADTEGMNRKQRARFFKALPEEQQLQIRAEMQALPQEEKSHLGRNIRTSPRQTKAEKEAYQAEVAAKAEAAKVETVKTEAVATETVTTESPDVDG